MRVFASVAATPAERQGPLAGDQLVTDADIVMDRAFTLPGSPEGAWPWLVQLGKQRGGLVPAARGRTGAAAVAACGPLD